MFKLFKLSLLILSVITLLTLSCNRENADEATEIENGNFELASEYRELLCDMGLNISTTVNSNEGTMIEGDIFFENSTLESIYLQEKEAQEEVDYTGDEITPRQYTVQGAFLPTRANIQTIDYFIDTNLPTDWQNAVITATADWTSITNCDVAFNRVFTHAAADISIFRDDNTTLPAGMRNLAANIFASACFPNGTTVGRFVSINHDNTFLTQQIQRTNTARHEIGHNLGFRHVNNASETAAGSDNCGNNFNRIQICGTPTDDANSVMRTGVKNDANFSNNDQNAARVLFPTSCAAPTILGVDWTYSGFGGVYSFTIYNSFPASNVYYRLETRISKSGGSTNTFFTSPCIIGPSYTNSNYSVTEGTGTYTVNTRVRNVKEDCITPWSSNYTFIIE